MGGMFGNNDDYKRQKQGWEGAFNIFNTGMPFAAAQQTAGNATTATGMGTLDQSKQFWTDILSGNRQATATAAAPAINAANQQADAGRREMAEMGTGRSGGATAANQQAETQRMAAGTNAIFGARPAAANANTGIAETQINTGQQELTRVLQALGLSQQTIAQIIQSSGEARQKSFEMNPLNGLPTALLDKGLSIATGGLDKALAVFGL